MVDSPDFADFLRDQLAPLCRITLRRMFGKTGVFCDGVMLGMVTDNTLYFRVDDQNRATFKEAESAPPLNYRKRGTTIDLSFWRIPERLFDEPDEFVTWARPHWLPPGGSPRSGNLQRHRQNRGLGEPGSRNETASPLVRDPGGRNDRTNFVGREVRG